MNGRYFILIFEKNENGEKIKYELCGVPNGTSFNNSPIHINSNGDIWVTWGPDYAANGLEEIKGLTIIPTNVTKEICLSTLAKGLGISDKKITRKNKSINNFLVNIFRDYVPEHNLN